MIVALDHIVVAAATLEQAENHLESVLGERPQRGGKHVAMGTHNSVLKLGRRTYLELIAVDPEGQAPPRPRWFAMDTAAMRDALASGPRLIHWVARTDDIEAARRASPIDPGRVHPMERGTFRWRITIPDDGHLPGDGILPTLIQWDVAQHPADAMPDSGVQLSALAGAHPAPNPIRAALRSLGLQDTVKVTFAQAPRLAAMLRTPRGPITL